MAVTTGAAEGDQLQLSAEDRPQHRQLPLSIRNGEPSHRLGKKQRAATNKLEMLPTTNQLLCDRVGIIQRGTNQSDRTNLKARGLNPLRQPRQRLATQKRQPFPTQDDGAVDSQSSTKLALIISNGVLQTCDFPALIDVIVLRFLIIKAPQRNRMIINFQTLRLRILTGKEGIVKPVTVKTTSIRSAGLLKRGGCGFVQAEVKKTCFHAGPCIGRPV